MLPTPNSPLLLHMTWEREGNGRYTAGQVVDEMTLEPIVRLPRGRELDAIPFRNEEDIMKRLVFIPQASVMVMPISTGLLVVRVDLEEAIRKSPTEQAILLENPPLAYAGKPYTFRPRCVSKMKGSFKLLSAAAGVTIQGGQELKWSVPADRWAAEPIVLEFSSPSGYKRKFDLLIPVQPAP